MKKSSYNMKGLYCPVCQKYTLEVIETPYFIPNFGNSLFFLLKCNSCKYKNNDVISLEDKKPFKETITINSIGDMNIRIIKGSTAKVIIPEIIEIESSSLSEGYVSNIWGLLSRVIKTIEFARDCSSESDLKSIANSHIKKLKKVMAGKDSIEITIDDVAGNSKILGPNEKLCDE